MLLNITANGCEEKKELTFIIICVLPNTGGMWCNEKFVWLCFLFELDVCILIFKMRANVSLVFTSVLFSNNL